jgi:hypothetical protein
LKGAECSERVDTTGPQGKLGRMEIFLAQVLWQLHVYVYLSKLIKLRLGMELSGKTFGLGSSPKTSKKKTLQIAHLKLVNVIIHKLFCNKTDKK